jgi:hypothetical protein
MFHGDPFINYVNLTLFTEIRMNEVLSTKDLSRTSKRSLPRETYLFFLFNWGLPFNGCPLTHNLFPLFTKLIQKQRYYYVKK